jgi:hypothetical protein
MAWSPSLISALYLIAIAASPIVEAIPSVRSSNGINLPLAKKLNLAGSTIIERDQARAKALKSNASNKSILSKRQTNEPVDNVAVVYSASVDIGSPSTTCEFIFPSILSVYYLLRNADNLLIDTGSSNTWVGADTKFTSTSTTTKTDDSVVRVSSQFRQFYIINS